MGQQRPLRVLVAEDELIVGYDLCDTVSEAGYIVEGPFGDLSSAMLAYQKTKPDIAILDVQLGDGIVYPLAEQMMAENIEVIFHSG
ncbi:MAG: response regulator, partial [Qipengyuania vulgaris]